MVTCLSYCYTLALLFSATFRKKVERLCRDILTDPVRIVVGSLGEVCDVIVSMGTILLCCTGQH